MTAQEGGEFAPPFVFVGFMKHLNYLFLLISFSFIFSVPTGFAAAPSPAAAGGAGASALDGENVAPCPTEPVCLCHKEAAEGISDIMGLDIIDYDLPTLSGSDAVPAETPSNLMWKALMGKSLPHFRYFSHMTRGVRHAPHPKVVVVLLSYKDKKWEELFKIFAESSYENIKQTIQSLAENYLVTRLLLTFKV